MALIEIDGLPIVNMGGFSIAMFNYQRVSLITNSRVETAGWRTKMDSRTAPPWSELGEVCQAAGTRNGTVTLW